MNKKLYLTISGVILIIVFLLILSPVTAQALNNSITLEVGIGTNNTTSSITEYIKTIYLFASGIVGGLAAIMIVVGAIQYSTAAGSSKGIASAKETIISAIIGLVIVGTAYLILGTFGTQFTNLKEPTLPEVSVWGQGSSEYVPTYERCTENEKYFGGVTADSDCNNYCTHRYGRSCRRVEFYDKDGSLDIGFCCEESQSDNPLDEECLNTFYSTKIPGECINQGPCWHMGTSWCDSKGIPHDAQIHNVGNSTNGGTCSYNNQVEWQCTASGGSPGGCMEQGEQFANQCKSMGCGNYRGRDDAPWYEYIQSNYEDRNAGMRYQCIAPNF